MRGRDGPPDKRLFRRARQGDRQAFLLLLRRYDPRLRRLVLRLVAEPDRVDAVLRRAYVKAWRSLSMTEPPGTVSDWFYRAVYNACVNELRWAPQRPPPGPVEGPRVPLPVASAERRLAGLRALTPEERIPLALVDGEGFSLEATARILQRPPVAVAADLSRARGRWRSFVVGDGLATGAPEAVELEPDIAAAEAQAEADDIGPADIEAVTPDAQPRHVRVVATIDGNGQVPASPLETKEDALGDEPAPDEPAPDDQPTPSLPPAQPADAPPTTSTDAASTAGEGGNLASAAADAADGGEGDAAEDVRSDVAMASTAAGDGDADGVEAKVEAVEDGQGSQATSTATDPADAAAGDGAPAEKPSRKNGAGASGAGASGAGARRKRRRDAKRDVRTRARGGSSPAPPQESGKTDAGAHDDGQEGS